MIRCNYRLALVLVLLAATAAPASAEDASFTLVNRGGNPIRELFVTPAGDARWGQNRVADHPIPAGGHFLVKRRADGNCILDIRAVFADGRAEERKALNTCNIDSVAVGVPAAAATGAGLGKDARDPSIRLVNRGGQSIIGFYAAPPGHAEWGENRLAAGPLPPATEKLVRIANDGTCLFDLRVVFADHAAKEKHGTDLCKLTDLPVP
jgi:hypothetical protein